MLTGKQKRYLRSLAMTTKPLIQVGKNGLGDAFVAGVKDALETRELVKISLLPTADDTPREVADTLQAAITGLEVAQIIGRTVIVYKEAAKTEHRRISLEVNAR
ncbi:YhbY family RNA-binding protein [Lacticaseibacillus casei]|jgi:RNA-binding protein|uniref:YhbY family RNA-binding protein n=2 Tax=Lacticaseibacillus TaxID=2759736 RepID=A0ABY9L2U9_9LACO|nr:MULTISPECIES: YhbY family RNA-binding protein [Lacticaseibacillus]KLI74771.1 RNA-binding protein [Lacticaseibacillus casei]MDG3060571.1 YhbY family RNA-binding protein [Lacticaseibacillus sp. BCRC 81376]QVI37591.1 YhbY family RNA-binding protein [Lacticaseibacillus casei]QXG59378.1 YhbY family RNA-binding protein [Lacticaseibacillus casei]WFB39163.1 YhbY family RNA-binding protein [Lacticaseibacillus huelsenbergensis]